MRFAGERMKRIWLQKPSNTRDEQTGQQIEGFTDADNDPNPWANVRDKRGAELFKSDKTTAELHRVFQVHARNDVNETWTILDDDRRFDITAIHPIGARKLDIEATWTQGKYDE